MRVLVSTTTDPDPVARALAATGRCRPLVAPGARDFQRLIGEADALVTGNARADLHRPDIEAHAGHLRWIQFSSAGFDALHRMRLPAGIVVSRSMGVWSPPVAEHALALCLALLRGLHKGHSARLADVRSMRGLRIVLVGYGEIGRIFARHAMALGADVRPVARRARHEDGLDVLAAGTLGELLPAAAIVVVTAPEQPGARPILDRAAMALLPSLALVVNVGRGTTVDEAALAEALAAGRLGGAGLDVFEREPLPEDSPLRRLDNVILTPHSAGHGDPGSLERLASQCADNAIRILDGREPTGLVMQTR